MKKSLLALAVGMLLSTSVANAATVYFENTAKWQSVYAYTESSTGEEDTKPFPQLTPTEIGGHEVYAKETSREYVVFLDKPSFAQSPVNQTNRMKVEDGAVYDAYSKIVAYIKDGKYDTDFDPVTNSGIYLVGSMTNNQIDATYEFKSSASKGCFLENVTIPDGATFHIVSGEQTFGPAEAGAKVTPAAADAAVDATEEYVLSKNANNMTASGLYGVNLRVRIISPNIHLDVSKATGEAPAINYYGAYNVNGNWTLVGQFEDNKLEMPVDNNTDFGIFKTVGNQAWKEGTRMGADATNTSVTLGNEYTLKAAAGLFLLDNEVKVGNWVVTLAESDDATTVSFAQEGQAILIGTTPTVGASWTGTLAANTAVEVFNNGIKYLVPDGEAEISGNNLVYKYTISDTENEVSFSEDYDASIAVNFDDNTATITLIGANKPVMVVDGKDIVLEGSGNIYTASGVELANESGVDSDFSFKIGGVNYVVTLPSIIQYEAASVTGTLKAEEGTSTFAGVQSEVKKKDGTGTELKDFTQGKLVVDVTLNLSAKSVIFTWKADGLTGVDAIEADNNGDAVYFNLQGVRVANPENGIFIEVKGGKAVKVRK